MAGEALGMACVVRRVVNHLDVGEADDPDDERAE
jgi:hypothetical protein